MIDVKNSSSGDYDHYALEDAADKAGIGSVKVTVTDEKPSFGDVLVDNSDGILFDEQNMYFWYDK